MCPCRPTSINPRNGPARDCAIAIWAADSVGVVDFAGRVRGERIIRSAAATSLRDYGG